MASHPAAPHVVRQLMADWSGDEMSFTGTLGGPGNMPHGIGRASYTDSGAIFMQKSLSSSPRAGNSYAGRWDGGFHSGAGVYTWSDGSVHEGLWLNDHPHGAGFHRYANEDTCDGTWHKGRREGRRRDGECSHHVLQAWWCCLLRRRARAIKASANTR